MFAPLIAALLASASPQAIQHRDAIFPFATPLLTVGNGSSAGGAVTGAPQFVNVNTNNGTGNISSIATSVPTGTQNNDIAFLHVFMMDTSGQTITDPAGWTGPINSDIKVGTGTGAYNHKLYWKRLNGSEGGSTVTVNFSTTIGASGEAAIAVSLWRGCQTSGTPYELFATTRSGTTGADMGTYSITPTGPDRTFVAFYADDTTAVALSAGTHMTAAYNNATHAVLMATYYYGSNPTMVGESLTKSGTVARWGSMWLALLPATTVSSSTVTDGFMIGSVVMLAGFESGSFVDESPAGHTVTANGAAAVNNAAAKFGSYSAVYNGTSTCYHSSANSSDWHMPGSFTVEAWVMWPSTPGDGGIVMHWGSAGGDEEWAFFVSSGQLLFRFQDAGAGLRTVGTTWSGRVAGTWYHVAAVRTCDGWCATYVNGTQQGGVGQYVNGMLSGASQALEFGNDHLQSTLALNARIDEIRITKGFGRYGASFTAPTAAFPRS